MPDLVSYVGVIERWGQLFHSKGNHFLVKYMHVVAVYEQSIKHLFLKKAFLEVAKSPTV